MQYTKPDGVANKVIHEARIVLEQMRNPPVFLMVRRRVGKECPECWNKLTKKVKFANCKVCSGTGLITGYHSPIKINISRDISYLVDSSNLMDGDHVTQTKVSAWIGNNPVVSPGDVIVDALNQRFNIDQVAYRTRSQYIIRQVLQLTPLEKGHPAYLMEVDRGELLA